MIRFAEINYETLCYETASLRNGFAYEMQHNEGYL